jgi:iron-sulfur cluster assembly accessory protein
MNHTLTITTQARQQLNLMFEHDFTLKDKVLRISIAGKGCDGFDYAIGFTEERENDLIISSSGIDLYLDPFCSEYLNNITLDYQTDFANDQEGFVITNNEQQKTKGKFWLKQESKKEGKED